MCVQVVGEGEPKAFVIEAAGASRLTLPWQNDHSGRVRIQFATCSILDVLYFNEIVLNLF